MSADVWKILHYVDFGCNGVKIRRFSVLNVIMASGITDSRKESGMERQK